MVNRIKELRENRNLTYQEVADIAGTSLQQIRRLELGERRLTDDWMRRIATALRVHPAELLLDFPTGSHKLQQRIDDVFLLEWWHSLSLAQQLSWIARFSMETGQVVSPDEPKKRNG